MSIEVKIPALGESVSEGVIVRWIKSNGEQIALDDPLLELETDKASVEVPSPAAGVLTIVRQEGDKVQVGEVVASIDPKGVATATSAPAKTADASKMPAPTPAPAPPAPTPAKAAAPEPAKPPAPLSPAVRR